jgi:drug/metabolite transporter (DMT)-like permease
LVNNAPLGICTNISPVFYFLKKQIITMNRTIGIVLAIIGSIMLIWTGFTYTKKEKIVDAGPIQISADRQHSVNWPPYAGGILLIAGVVLIATAKKA